MTRLGYQIGLSDWIVWNGIRIGTFGY
jgi:hypothetical protein